MQRKLRFTPTAHEQLCGIETDPALAGILKQIRKTLGYLETNIFSKSLQTHKHDSLTIRYKREVFEAYAQQHTPGAYRVYWYYGPDEVAKSGKRTAIITVLFITPHTE